MSRFRNLQVSLIMLAALAVLALPLVVQAGGVAVVLVQQPVDVEAEMPFTVSFLVRSAHEDAQPITGLEPTITLTRLETKQQVSATAQPEKKIGHYAASITLPTAGEWRWTIQPFSDSPEFRSTQPPLLVRAPSAALPIAKGLPAGPLHAVTVGNVEGVSWFEPKTLTIAAGTTVRWQNDGTLLHTVTAADGLFASGAVQPGGTFEYRFAEAGTYRYYCEYHGSATGQGQFGTLVVTASQPNEPAADPAVQLAQPAVEQAAPADHVLASSQQLPAAGTVALPLGAAATIVGALVLVGLLLVRRRAHTS